ncbi:MAG TPA: prefoldin subunit alpha [Candidatus Nanoarchaeia archaeon]|nr:prefoldin subunit alpha [Candidatus Nanoarchaeia archaeon]
MQKELQKRYLELQLLDQQIKQIQKNIELIENQMAELESMSISLEELSSVKPGTEIFVPVAGGVFAKAELKDNKDLVINVGAGTAVKKSITQTKGMIANQINDIASARDELLMQLHQFVSKAQKIQQDLIKLQEEKE